LIVKDLHETKEEVSIRFYEKLSDEGSETAQPLTIFLSTKQKYESIFHSKIAIPLSKIPPQYGQVKNPFTFAQIGFWFKVLGFRWVVMVETTPSVFKSNKRLTVSLGTTLR
jgi:hypothetical protein